MKRTLLITLTLFSLSANHIFGQTPNNYALKLQSYYEEFAYSIAQYGEESTKPIESFERMLNYYNGLPKDNLYDRDIVYKLIEANIKWESILNEIYRTHSPEFCLRLQKTHIENNELATRVQFPAEAKVYEASYDGGEGYREQLVLNKADLFLSVLYDRALFSASLNTIDDVFEIVIQWFSVWEKCKKVYSSKDEFDKCVILLTKYLSTTLFNIGMQSQAIGLLLHIYEMYFTLENKSNAVGESLENTNTLIALLMSNLGDLGSAMIQTSQASYYPPSFYFDINDFLVQASIHARSIRDYDANKSIEELERAVRIIELGRVGKNGRPASRKTKSMVYNEMSSSYLRKKMHNEQLRSIKKAIEEDGDFFAPVHMHNLAAAYYDVGDWDNAMDIYQLLEDNNLLNIDSYSNMAFIAYRQKKYWQSTEYAEKYFKGVVSDFQKTTRFMTPRVREQYFSDNYHLRYFYNYLTSLAKDNPLGMPLAFNASLYQKGLLVRMNNETRRRINASCNNELQQAYSGYLNSLVYDDYEKASFAESHLQSLFPKYLDFTDKSFNLGWEDIRNTLEVGEVAIEFVTYSDFVKHENRYAALVLKSDYDSPKMVELCGCNELRTLFNKVDAYGYPRVYDFISEPSELIWGPLKDILSNVKTVYYSPCEELSQINMDVMTFGSGGKPMNQAFRMIRMLSTADMIERRVYLYESASLMGGFDYGSSVSSPDSANGDFFRGFNRTTGWDDIESKEEIAGINLSLNKITKVSLVMGAGANEATIKSVSGDSPSILHLATHGFYLGFPEARGFAYYSSYGDNWIPEDVRCGLILSGANDAWLGRVAAGGNDGTLTAKEINGLDLSKTELVVLSACQTGLGENTSEGTYGLMRAFKNAGVGAIIMSLWKVNDNATILFMTTFYKQLATGKERHVAFNKAQETVRKKFPEARYWAAFVMVD